MDPLEEMTPEQFDALTDDQRLALLMGEGLETPPQDPAAAPETTPETPAQDPEPQAPAPEHFAAPQAQAPGQDLAAALQQEQLRRQQLEQLLQDPQALSQLLAQHQPQQAPELAVEDPEVLGFYVQQAMAPLQQTVQQLQAQLAQERQAQELMGLRQQYPDLDETIGHFDAQVPQMAGLPPLAKYLMVHGDRAIDPAYQQQQIEAKVNAEVEKRLAEHLAKLNPGAQAPVTLSGVTPSGSSSDGIDLANISPEQWDSLDEKTRERLLRG